MMHFQKFSFLRAAMLGDLYLCDDAVFLSRKGVSVPPTKIGSLAGEAKLLTARVREAIRQTGGTVNAPVIGILLHWREFIWTIEELIPCCRAWEDDGLSEPVCPEGVRRILDQIGQLAPQIQPAGAKPDTGFIPASAVREWLKVPCAIMGGRVVPMRRARLWDKPDQVVRIEGASYKLRPERALPVGKVVEEAWAAATKAVANAAGQGIPSSEQERTLIALVESVIKYHEPRSAGSYVILHDGAEQQVQYANGMCALVRGPIRDRSASQTLYAGLFVSGVTREQLLTNVPRVGPGPDLMWPPANRGAMGSVCVGTRAQYQHLYSDAFSDAEAFCHWLDATRILLTRSLRRPPVPPQRRRSSSVSVLAQRRRAR